MIPIRPTKRIARLLNQRLSALLLSISLGLIGCGGGGGGSNFTAGGPSSGSAIDGQLAVSLTDAKGDFLSYTVDVSSLTLTKENGAVVETVPTKTQVDFAQYTDLTEFLTAATIPSGQYTSATLTLDYSNANIQVEDANGSALKVSKIVGSDGTTPVTKLGINVVLDKKQLIIAPGVPRNLMLDFNLAQSNTVTFDAAGAATVQVQPVLIADVELKSVKAHRLRGGLKSVDVATNSFNVTLRPFVQALFSTDQLSTFGTVNVTTSNNTVFEIDGVSYDGTTGIRTLNTLSAFTAIVAIGTTKLNPLHFEATEVYVGSSVAGGTLDGVRGNIVSRSGDTLVINGATLIRKTGTVIFHDQVTVKVADTTKVSRQLEHAAVGTYSMQDLSVGQRVFVAGTVTDSNPASLTIDAGTGHVRMLVTALRGTVVTAQPLVLNLQSIDGRKIDLFNFAGTGTTGNDAVPTAYRISTGSLDLSGISNDMPISVRGFVARFGAAPPDFTAITIVDVADVRALLSISWLPLGNTTALGNPVGSTAISLDLTGAKSSSLRRAGVSSNVANGTQIKASDRPSAFVIIESGAGEQLYSTFADFVSGLQSRLNNSKTVQSLAASGSYVDSTSTLTSDLVSVRMK